MKHIYFKHVRFAEHSIKVLNIYINLIFKVYLIKYSI